MQNGFKTFLIFLIFYLLPLSGFLKAAEFTFSWDVRCFPENICKEIDHEYLTSPIEINGHESMVKHIKTLLLQPGVESLSYQAYQLNDMVNYRVQVGLRPIVNKIVLEGVDAKISRFVTASLGLNEGEYFDQQKLNDGLFKLNTVLVEKGLLGSKSSWNFDQKSSTLKIFFTHEKNIFLKEISFHTDGPENNEAIEKIKLKLVKFFGKKLDIDLLKQEIQIISEDLKAQGYINSLFELSKLDLSKVDDGNISLVLNYRLGQKVLFQFYGNERLTRQDLILKIRGLFNKYQLDLSISGLEQEIIKSYEEKGIYNTEVKTVVRDELNGDGWIYYFQINEGNKIAINNRVYLGNKEVTRDEIETVFNDQGTDLVRNHFYDQKFYENSSTKIENIYLKKGYVLVSVEPPTLQANLDNTEAIVVFKIKEGPKATVTEININDLNETEIADLRDKLTTKKGLPFSPMDFEQDLELIKNYFKEKGYIFSRFKAKEDSFIVYDKKFENVAIDIDFEKGPLVKVKNILIVGTTKTRHKAIYRETQFTRGDILTVEKMEVTSEKLNGLGLFSNVEVRPIGQPFEDGTVDVLITVKERNFGSLEVTPGYRTDLGAKLGTEIGYNNLFGMNRSVRFKTEVNQRLTNEGLDETRRADGSNRRDGDKFPEYGAEIGFGEPYIFNLPLAFNTSLSHSRRRYLSVDAYNTKASATLSKDWTSVFSTALGYQLENISQFNATKKQDEGNYRIGALTPTVVFDFRNSKVYATKGSLFKLSFEYAGPTLLSQDNTYPKIHFYKAISRNNFYFPIFNDLVFATSLSGGVQQNLAKDYLRDFSGNLQTTDNGTIKTEGHIPSIKVFRLGGVNPVRGYSDIEVNRLIGESQSITDVLVQDRAYFINVNLEPRYQVSDDLILGTFIDAGRVYIDSMRPEKMRKSVGFSLKYLTAVGTVDFHYGFKLDRREDLGEQIGRFHFSIGQF